MTRCACCCSPLPNRKLVYCPADGPSLVYCDECAAREIGNSLTSIRDARYFLFDFLRDWFHRERLRDDLYRATMKDDEPPTSDDRRVVAAVD
jgi:hypothetical protein